MYGRKVTDEVPSRMASEKLRMYRPILYSLPQMKAVLFQKKARRKHEVAPIDRTT